MEDAIRAAESAYDNTDLFIYAGGNSLLPIGEEATVECIESGVRRISGANGRINNTVICSIAPRMRASRIFKDMRLKTNRLIKDRVEELAREGIWISFLDLDLDLLDDAFYKEDGVHLNEGGVRVMGRCMLREVGRLAKPPSGGRALPQRRRLR